MNFKENKDFYPTPVEIIEKMLEPYKLNNFKTILEPSAWKGDIVKYINNNTYNTDIYSLESDINLQPILKQEKTIFLWDNFLKYSDTIKFNLIVMNPPFSNWVDHLLKAWEVAQNWTEIVCLLNAKTIENDFSEKRKLLLKVIEDNKWTIENLWSCFENVSNRLQGW